jgi:isobutyryl-CoA mutase
MKDLLDQNQASHVKIFGGGGGTILPAEIEELHKYGISKIYSPDDGRKMGLEGMIEDVIEQCRAVADKHVKTINGYALNEANDIKTIARAITLAERGLPYKEYLQWLQQQNNTDAPNIVLGITGTGGAGKSSVTDEIVRRFLNNFLDKTVAVISVDPSKKKTGGALLGDRIRMNSINNTRAYMRSLATKDSEIALSPYVKDAIEIVKAAGFNLIILESAGVGQSDASILQFCDVSLYVMTPEYGAASQLEKINMLDYADVIAINKFDKAGSLDALADVRKQYKRNHNLFTAADESLPIVGTMASKFNDEGVNQLFNLLLQTIASKTQVSFGTFMPPATAQVSQSIIPPARVRYLSELSDSIRAYNNWVTEQSAIASKMYVLDGAIKLLEKK